MCVHRSSAAGSRFPTALRRLADAESLPSLSYQKTESNGGPTAVYTYNSAGINQSIPSIQALLALPSLSVVGDYEVTSIVAPATTFVSTVSSNTGTDLLATSTSASDLDPSGSSTNLFGGGTTPTSTAGRLQRRAPTSTSGAPSSSATSVAASYLGVVMASTSMTVGAGAATPSASATAGGGGGGGPNTGLAMIILVIS